MFLFVSSRFAFLTTIFESWFGRVNRLEASFFDTEIRTMSLWKSIFLRSKMIQEAQLPQRNSASAAHVEGGYVGLGPPAPSPSAPLATPMRMAESESYNVRTSNVPSAARKAHFKINRAFKVIQGHPYWCRQEPRMVFCRNVQLMPTLFLKLTKIRQRENGKFVDFNDLTQVW